MPRLAAGLMMLAVAAAIVPSAERGGDVAAPGPPPAREGLVSEPARSGATEESSAGRSASLAPAPASGPEEDPRAPLTGRRVDADAVDRPVLAVKVDNAPTARPQAGLQHADVVMVQPIEAATRFIALYHATDPGRLGPVRSGRFVDAELLPPFDPLLAMSGAAEPVREALRRAGLPLYETGSAGAWDIDESRRAPHQVFLEPAALWEVGQGRGVPPADPVWAFDEAVPGRAERVERAAWRYPAATAVVWRWDGRERRWVRSQDGRAQRTVDGTRVGADNVVVLRVPRGPDHTRPIEVVGAGELTLLRDGRRLTGTWRKPSRGAHFAWRDDEGEPLSLRPGTTWIELVPAHATVTVDPREPRHRVPSAL